MRRLEGKIALVLGASRNGNMGQAIASRFLREGAKVVVSGRSRAGLEAFASAAGAYAVSSDIAKKAEIQALADDVIAKFGRIDIAVNAAATGQYGPFEETNEETIDEMLAIIFKGSFFFMQVMVAAMKQERAGRRGGAIVNISSAVADIMYENHAAYMGAKAGMNHITRCVANEYGKYGIRANVVAPGLTDTPMLAGFKTPGMIAAFEKEYPLGRITTVEDVAAATLFAVDDECFMTGQTLHVTGGLTLRRNPTPDEIAAAITAAECGA